jgi:hypothetical protein
MTKALASVVASGRPIDFFQRIEPHTVFENKVEKSVPVRTLMSAIQSSKRFSLIG